MTHTEFITSIANGVRDAGAVATLDALRAARADMPAADGGMMAYHDTIVVFFVWAVDRLATAGLDDVRIMWHPLTDVRSPLTWWDARALASIEAMSSFVASTKALPGEPAPFEPRAILLAA